MATYLYKCDTCGTEREIGHAMNHQPEILCITCTPGHKHSAPELHVYMRRMIASAVPSHLKGVGWSSDGYSSTSSYPQNHSRGNLKR